MKNAMGPLQVLSQLFCSIVIWNKKVNISLVAVVSGNQDRLSERFKLALLKYLHCLLRSLLFESSQRNLFIHDID